MPSITSSTTAPSERERLAAEVRAIIAKGHRFADECATPVRNLTVNVIPGNGCRGNLAMLAVAGTPTRGAVCVSLTHDRDSISRNIATGKPLSQKEVDVLRDFICHLSGQHTAKTVPGNFAWESGVLYADGKQMHPGTDARAS